MGSLKPTTMASMMMMILMMIDDYNNDYDDSNNDYDSSNLTITMIFYDNIDDIDYY